MTDFCDDDCGACRMREVFGKCPRDVVDDEVIEYVLAAWKLGRDEGLRFAEQAVEYSLSVETPALRSGPVLCRRN